MLDSMRLQLRRSEISERLAALSAKTEALTDDEVQERGQLTDEFQTNETEYREAVKAEAAEEAEAAAGSKEGSAEHREILRLQERASISAYMASSRAGRIADGPELELNQALGIDRGVPGDFPLRILAPAAAPAARRGEQALQERADVSTDLSADAIHAPSAARGWLDRLWHGTPLAYLGVTFDSVSAGMKPIYTRITGGTSAAAVARGAQQDAAALTLATTEIEPERISARYRYSLHDVEKLGPRLEAALRADLARAMTDEGTRITLLGNAAPKIQGLVDATVVTNVTDIPLTAAKKFKGHVENLESLAGLLDGLHATEPMDLRTLWGRPAYTQLMSALAIPEDTTTLAGALRAEGYGIRVTDRIATAVAVNAIVGIAARQQAIRGAFMSAWWMRGSLVSDIYSRAAQAEVDLSMHAFCQNAMIRSDSYALLQMAGASS